MKPVKIYTASYCGFCSRAKQFLQSKGVPYEEIDVTSDDQMRQKLVQMSNGQRTVPQIFVGETHVGGYSDMIKLDSEGRFQPLLG
jgi:glutaredoxin 3